MNTQKQPLDHLQYSSASVEDRLRQFFFTALRKREVTGITLAEKAGVHRTTISRWINGKISISLATLDKMIAVLGKDNLLEFLQNHRAKTPD